MKRFNYLLIALLSSLMLFSCNSDNDKTPDIPKKPDVPEIVQDQRVFVLNEGQFSKELGFLDVITPDRNYTSKVDKGVIGGTAQGLSFYGDRTYIISKDSQNAISKDEVIKMQVKEGKGRLVSLKTKDFSDPQDHSDLIKSLEKPAKIAIIDLNNIFILDSNGIHRLDLIKGQLTAIDGAEQMAEYDMIVVGNLVVAGKGNTLITIQKGENKVHKSLQLDDYIEGYAKADGNNIYVATSSATIYKINAQDLSIVKQNKITGEASTPMNDYWGRASMIAAHGDSIYYAGGGSVIYRHLFSKGETKAMVDVKTLYPAGTITYHSVGVSPVTGHVYIARLKGYGLEFTTNAIIELDLSGDTAKLIKLYQNQAHFPANFYFPN